MNKMWSLLLVAVYFIQAKVNVECKDLNGYLVNKTSGKAYRLVYQSQSWPVAKDKCEENGEKLAVPETKEEFLFIQKLVRGMYYPKVNSSYKLLAWLGINNLDNYKVWETVDGKDVNGNEFHIWAAGNGDSISDDVREPHCVGLDAINFGFRDWWCHRRQPYICQLDIIT